MCSFKQDDVPSVILGGLRCAAVLTMISTRRLSSFSKCIIFEEQRSVHHATTLWPFLGKLAPSRSWHVTRTRRDVESSHKVSLSDELRNQRWSWPKEKITQRCSSCYVRAVSLARWVAWNSSSYSRTPTVSPGSPLFVRNQTAPPMKDI